MPNHTQAGVRAGMPNSSAAVRMPEGVQPSNIKLRIASRSENMPPIKTTAPISQVAKKNRIAVMPNPRAILNLIAEFIIGYTEELKSFRPELWDYIAQPS